ncbi:response regulator [Nocardioides coralli]|uniref:response regulator n=1 Tax=Nocardioides coralli TaxID=2872154 RepID=UPI001CA38E16|nr:response regulator [Nocardioides coralli]QZY29579.1 response regulator [Nocardioides coralli]
MEREASHGRVLVVDDDEMIRELVAAGLEDKGHHVLLAGDGVEALAHLRSTPVDLVVTDVQMPRLDGFGLLEQVRADPETSAVPVVVMTTLSDPEHVVSGLRLGADDYVRKPFDLGELVARVQTRIDRPPVSVAGFSEARKVGVLTADRIVLELERELRRSEGGLRSAAVAVLHFAEQQALAERFGRQGLVDVVRMAAQVAQGRLGPLDLAGLLPGRGSGELGLLLVLPDTPAEDAARRLAEVASAIAADPFTVHDEHVNVTPVTGWTTAGDVPLDRDPSRAIERAALAADQASAHLDLMPIRWSPELQAFVEATRAGRRDRVNLATPVQVLVTLMIGLAVPFAGYLLLHRFGIDPVGVAYPVVVLSLVVTAALIWTEGFLALGATGPPREAAGPPPRASAIIAAYLPNEAATVMDTVEHFLSLDYPGGLQVVLAYNTPHPMPIEDRLADLARRDHRFVPFRVDGSTSKAQNVNTALAIVDGEITGVFDADHHPDPGSFQRAWRWLSHGYDVVQGHCVVRNGDTTLTAQTVAVEFEAIYAVSHPGRARLHGFGIFGGSNGYWRTQALRHARMQGRMLTEDIDSSMRALQNGRRIASDPGLLSRELAPTTWKALWHQRMRWAQGWFQVSMRHLLRGWKASHLSLRNKLGLFFLLGWREIYPWLSIQMFPLVAFMIWREGGQEQLDWVIPVFVLTTIFTLSVGPGQVLFAYLLGAPEIRQRRAWFWAYLVVASLFYTEFKNVIARVAQLKELAGERRWVVTPRQVSTRPEAVPTRSAA